MSSARLFVALGAVAAVVATAACGEVRKSPPVSAEAPPPAPNAPPASPPAEAPVESSGRSADAPVAERVCLGRDAVVVPGERVGPLKVGATMAELDEACPGAKFDMTDYSGIQGPSHTFALRGATVTATQFGCRSFDQACPTQAPTYWIISGDSVRMPDSSLAPRSIGELQRRYGAVWVTKDDGDDAVGAEGHVCRFSKLYFMVDDADVLRVTLTPTPPQIAGVSDGVSIRKWFFGVPGQDTGDRFCPGGKDFRGGQ